MHKTNYLNNHENRSSGGGNIITRRLCRNRRREDNELYRSNSFKFERFERKEYLEELADTLQKQVRVYPFVSFEFTYACLYSQIDLIDC